MPADPTPVSPKASDARGSNRRRRPRWWRRVRALLVVVALAGIALSGVVGYWYARLSRDVDAKLRVGIERALPRIFAQPLELRRGQALSPAELVDWLDDLGYRERPAAADVGQFAAAPLQVTVRPRAGSCQGELVTLAFSDPTASDPTKKAGPLAQRLAAIQVAGRGAVDAIALDAPMLSALVTGDREKRRRVPLSTIPVHVRQAVLAIEDRRFYEHPGVDPIRTLSAIVTNIRGDKPYLVGGSTLTQQLVKNSFLTREKTIKRKLSEQLMALILERRLTKDEILELYLNDVYLGQRGSFAIHGVAAAARVFFAKNVANLSLAEAATIAGVIQSPPAYSPFRAPQRCRDRRNVVLRSMVEAGYVPAGEAERASAEPLTTVSGGVDAEAPYFVDLVSQAFVERYPSLADGTHDVAITTTLDPRLQRLAQNALVEGLVHVDEQLAKKKRQTGAQAALIALDPRTGDVRALVGGRSYGQSQLNRATMARRQPGSVFKPFVYLAAFEYAAQEGRTDLTPATIVVDEPTSFFVGDEEWTPGNYNDEYDGPITLRRALAMSRNVATAKVAEFVGFGRIAALWRQVDPNSQARGYPSIALGVFEATPWEIAEAYTLFANLGELRALRTITRITSDGTDVALPAQPPARRVTRPDTTFLVRDMMRSVVDEGTGAGARAAGFSQQAAGKTGTTNDLRDAWFVGFTQELLTVVWVGFDDNTAIGLSGSQAAVPIWADFMARATAGLPAVSFSPVPFGVSFVEIDRDTGMLPSPGCPRLRTEVFLTGTEPTAVCDQHGF